MDYPLRLVDQLRAHLRALRKQRGLTQAQLGQRLGLSQVRIAEIEAKPSLVSVDQLVRILSAMGALLILRDQASDAEVAAPAKAPSTPTRKTTHAKAPAGRTAANKPTSRATRTPRATTPAANQNKGSW